jgi:isocitrate dehydrogenase
VNTVLASRRVTVDLAGQMPGAKTVGCARFGELLGESM